VYLTFGTVFNRHPVLGEAIRGASRTGRRVVVTVGPHGDPAALGPQPDRVHAARFIPQSLLLPRCAAVISHGGSGTVLGTLAAGVPQLCLPQGADQFLNAAAVARSGAGLQLVPDEVTADAVEAALRRLLDEPEFRLAAARAADAIAAMPDIPTVADAVESLVTGRHAPGRLTKALALPAELEEEELARRLAEGR
jgi:UDP:flavonoid glycosyltransferase YjiC (YdhE family)